MLAVPPVTHCNSIVSLLVMLKMRIHNENILRAVAPELYRLTGTDAEKPFMELQSSVRLELASK